MYFLFSPVGSFLNFLLGLFLPNNLNNRYTDFDITSPGVKATENSEKVCKESNDVEMNEPHSFLTFQCNSTLLYYSS